MKRTTLYILILLSSLLAACQDDQPDAGTTPDGGSLRIAYRVAGTDVQTKADTEQGTDALNENKVTRLDLFAFNANGNRIGYQAFTTSGSDDLYSPTYQTLEVSEENLSLEAVQNNANGSYYLVANCPSVASITTLQSLKDAMTTGSTDNPALITTDGNPPTAFIMDAKAVPASDGDNITLSFDLRRAAAKIRFRITSSQGYTPTDCQFFQQAASTHVLDEAETYNNGATDWADYRTITNDFPLRENSTEDGYVFYSYPNDWFNANLYVETSQGSGIYKYDENHEQEGMHGSEPIIKAKQTYLMLRATDNSNAVHYYKIPVNRSLPDNSDQPTFTEKELEAIHDLYRLKRNHLYDVAITIDGPGGTLEEPVVPQYTIKINDWVNGHPDGNDSRYELPPDAFQ